MAVLAPAANPLIIQGDFTVLVEVASPLYEEARDSLVRFAELVKAPEHVHSYRVTPLSIWNACAAGLTAEIILDDLNRLAKYPVPSNVASDIRDYASRYGRVTLRRDDGGLLIEAATEPLAEQIARAKQTAPFLAERLSDVAFRIAPAHRGEIKQALIKLGFPARDIAGYVEGEPLPLLLRETTQHGQPFLLRPYQRDAVAAFGASAGPEGGSGVITLPCGAGKTIVGMGCMGELQESTLILTASGTAARQWIAELLDKTTLEPEQVGEYDGSRQQVRPVTVATYQMLTWRPKAEGDFPHMAVFDQRNWGLIIYDEVHLLPAPIFRATAGLQARRRLGLTATLVREDGREGDVFALIGPRKADVPWKVLEHQGWIATARCTEIRLPLPPDLVLPYAVAAQREQARLAAENPRKLGIVRQLLAHHADAPTLIIGTYIDQLEAIARPLNLPLLTGATSQRKRDALFGAFRRGEERVLVVSKIANFAVDLPDASVAIQISGSFGSRQEEAQRLGRLLRPKRGENQAHFYTLVTRDTVEQDFALHRQLFLAEQGYEYVILDTAADGSLELP